ncbi:MAG: rhodanese-like domain-containing protein [Pseudomonadota bacterium]
MHRTLVAVTLLVLGACQPSELTVQRAIAQAEASGAAIYAPVQLAAARETMTRAQASQDSERSQFLARGLALAREAQAQAATLSRTATQRGQEHLRTQRAAREEIERQGSEAVQAAAASRRQDATALPAQVTAHEPEVLQARLARGENVQLVDVRSHRAFAEGHITGALSAPAASLGYRRLRDDVDVVLYSDDREAGAAAQAAIALVERGYARISILGGGFALWKQHGLPWVRSGSSEGGVGLIHADALALALARGQPALALLDLRAPVAYAAGHLPGARNLPASELSGAGPELGQDLVVYGADDVAAALAARRLAETLGRNVRYLDGGVRAWVQDGQRLERAGTGTADGQRGAR